MFTLSIEHAITDFATWKTAFDRAAEARQRAGVVADRIRRPVGDDQYLVIELDFETMKSAESFREFLTTVVWSNPDASPALSGSPTMRILEAVSTRPPGARIETPEEAGAHLNRLHEGVWQLAAVAVALHGSPGDTSDLRRAAGEVLVKGGVGIEVDGDVQVVPGFRQLIGLTGGDPEKLASQAAAPILQASALLSGANQWTAQDDEALLAQGRASAQGAQVFKAFAVPMMPGMEGLLAAPSPVMLDVGVGVAAMAVAWCRAWPSLRIVGLDVFDRALELAERNVSDAGMVERIQLRHQDVTDLDEKDVFCLAWVPAPFIPPQAMDAGLARIAAALLPGGWIVVGHGKFSEDPLSGALTRFQTVAFGGTALDDSQAQNMLNQAGFDLVSTLPTPQGAPAITIGRRPAQ